MDIDVWIERKANGEQSGSDQWIEVPRPSNRQVRFGSFVRRFAGFQRARIVDEGELGLNARPASVITTVALLRSELKTTSVFQFT
jgi:hypothetical protein